MDMIRKLVPVEVKEVGDRQLEIAGSTEDVDRMGDIIKASGWKLGPFKKNPVFMWGHDYNQPPIGRATKVWVDRESKRLMFNVEFADAETYKFADTIYKLYKGGFLHATSVGFIPLEWEGKSEEEPNPKWEGNLFTKQELLELSAVPVPANANALVTARESGLITVKEFEAVTREPEAASTEDTINKPEETDEYIRIPVESEEGKHEDCTIRTIDVDKDKGIEAIYCVDHKVIMTYLFEKDNEEEWTIESAQAWVDENAKSYILVEVPNLEEETEPVDIPEGEESKPEPSIISQEQLRDDIDFVHRAIIKIGLNAATLAQALSMAAEIIQRSTGNDIPDNILAKVGAVLNVKNKKRLSQIQELAQEVLDSATATDEGGKQLGDLKPIPTEAELTRKRVLEVAEVAELAIAKLRGTRIY